MTGPTFEEYLRMHNRTRVRTGQNYRCRFSLGHLDVLQVPVRRTSAQWCRHRTGSNEFSPEWALPGRIQWKIGAVPVGYSFPDVGAPYVVSLVAEDDRGFAKFTRLNNLDALEAARVVRM